MQIKVATTYDDLINGPFLEVGGGSKKRIELLGISFKKQEQITVNLLMIGTFSGMGGAKKNSPKYAQLGYINMSALIQYFLTANPTPPSHIHHTKNTLTLFIQNGDTPGPLGEPLRDNKGESRGLSD